jgi:O-acetyl-ADP-ribose deacetylase (regulator of RNase III)
MTAQNNYKTVCGDVLNVTRGVIAHGVNCRGVMGAGVALQIAKRWPHVLQEYRNYLEFQLNEVHVPPLGHVHFVAITDDLFIANCFTQLDIRPVAPSTTSADLSAVTITLEKLAALQQHFRPSEQLPIHMPMIGCGLGGLKWQAVDLVVRDIVESYQADITVHHFGELS